MSTLPQGPLYDPKEKIRNFSVQEDFETIRSSFSVYHDDSFLYEDDRFYYHLGEEQEWRRPKEICNSPLFIDETPNRFDALQGYEVNDCYLISSIEALTINEPLIRHVVPPDQSFDYNYMGAFHFRLWRFGAWYDVVVDDRLPVYKRNGALVHARSWSGDVFWAVLLEKAYAKFYSENEPFYDEIYGTTGAHYKLIDYGLCITAMQDLSGGIVEIIHMAKPPHGIEIEKFIDRVFQNNAILCCFAEKSESGIIGLHGYAVTKVIKGLEGSEYDGLHIVRVMNPWGKSELSEWEGDWSDEDYDNWWRIDREMREKLLLHRRDGEFWMSMEDFVKYFTDISLCHLGPGQYLESKPDSDSVGFDNWMTKSFFGEWVADVSAGGRLRQDRHLNPQYIIQLYYPDNDVNDDGYSTVVIELSQRSKAGRTHRVPIAVYVYGLNELEDLPERLDSSFFMNNSPIDEHPDFQSSQGRAFVKSMKLELPGIGIPGKFCIVPCTWGINEESQFLLRVFSESYIEPLGDETQIGKSTPQEQTHSELDREIKSRFYEVSKGKDEIDWICLRQILQENTFAKREELQTTPSILNLVWNFFGSFLGLGSEREQRTFTKDECRSMIAMLDDDHSGKLNFHEFNNLWNKISFWTKVYEHYKDNDEGYIKISQLPEGLSSIGFNVNKLTINKLSHVYGDEHGNVSLTDFILCGVALETVLSNAQRKGSKYGNITLTLEEWVKRTLIL